LIVVVDETHEGPRRTHVAEPTEVDNQSGDHFPLRRAKLVEVFNAVEQPLDNPNHLSPLFKDAGVATPARVSLSLDQVVVVAPGHSLDSGQGIVFRRGTNRVGWRTLAGSVFRPDIVAVGGAVGEAGTGLTNVGNREVRPVGTG